MQSSQPMSLPPAGVLFDAPIGDRIGDLLAFNLLYALDAKDEVRAAALSVSKSNLQAAQFSEAMARFFQGGSPFFRMAVGLTDDKYSVDSSPMFDAVLKAKDDKDEPRWPQSIQKFTDTADNVPLLRNSLTGFHDGNAVVVCTGRATNLAKLLVLPGAKEIITKKARLLILTSAASADPAALEKVNASWPTPIVLAGDDLNEELRIPLSDLAAKITWTPDHPVLTAWKALGSTADPAPGAALAAIFHAARPKSEDLTLGPATGNQRKLQVSADAAPRLISTWLDLMSWKPEPRRRFRPPPVVDKPADKPAEKPKPPSGPA